MLLDTLIKKLYGKGLGRNPFFKKIYNLTQRYYYPLMNDRIIPINFKNYFFKVKVNPKYGNIDETIYFKKRYEPHICNLMTKTLKKGDYFVDIGANIGFLRLLASKLVEDGKVISFEPVPNTYNRLIENIHLNNVLNIVTYNLGAGSKNEEVCFYVNNGEQGLSSVIPKQDSKKEYLKVITLDNFFRENKIEKVNLIKIDAEGYEIEIFKGMAKTIENFHPNIIFEYSPMFYKKLYGSNWLSEVKNLLKFLNEQNYELFFIESDKINKITQETLFKIKKQKDVFCQIKSNDRM